MSKVRYVLVLALGCGGTSGTSGADAPSTPDAAPAPVMLSPGANDQQTVQAALIDAKPGQKILFAEGTYHFTDELSLSVAGVKLEGAGSRDATIFDFSGQKTGDNGLRVSQADDFVLQGITFQDTANTAVRVDNSTNVTFRNVKVLWTRGPSMLNGGYALYPVQCTNVLVEQCEVHGASDTGIYVGQSANIMVRNNTAEGNVSGIEIENSTGAEVMNNTASGNSGGILVFNLPNLQVKTGSGTLVHDNMVLSNNQANFGAAGGVVSYVPQGTGIVIMAPDNTEVRNNTIMGNDSVGIIIGSCSTLALLSSNASYCDDAGYDGFAEGIYVHDNTFTGNGTHPHGFINLFYVTADAPFPDIAWDGVVDSTKSDPLGMNRLCIQNNGSATFVKVDGTMPGQNESTDLAPYNCTHAALPSINVTWGNP